MRLSKELVAAVGIIVIILGVLGGMHLKQTIDELETENGDLQKRITNLEDDLSVRNTELSVKIEENDYLRGEVQRLGAIARELNDTKKSLEHDKETLTEDKTTLEKKLSAIRTEIDDTVDDLLDYEDEITDSMTWFQQNSNLDNWDEWNQMKNFIKGWCMDHIDDTCYIRVSCITFVTDYLEEFGYKTDTSITGKTDYLQDLGQLYENQGGDCEDYSLLAIAALNFMEDKCEERNRNDIRFIAFEQSEGDRHFVEDTQKYYLPDTKDFDIPKEKRNHHIVCGTFPRGYDPNRQTAGKVGHCVIGFSEYAVKDSSDVPKFLENALLVEPQNGAFLVDLSKPTGFHIPHDGEEKGEYPLNIVITEDDLYLYSEIDGENRWHGYTDYIALIRDLREELLMIE